MYFNNLIVKRTLMHFHLFIKHVSPSNSKSNEVKPSNMELHERRKTKKVEAQSKSDGIIEIDRDEAVHEGFQESVSKGPNSNYR